jgi:hypothetical protein
MFWKPHRGWLIGLALVLLLAIVPGMVRAQASFGSNWVAEYWNNTDFSGVPVATVVYPTGLNFNWGTGQPTGPDGQPLLAVPADNFSARFQTTENFTTAGEYTFFGFVDDRIRVFIDGIEVFSQNTPGTFSFVRTLTAGVHSLRVDYVELTDTAILQFQWQLGGVAPPGVQPVQPEVPTGPTARVVNVRGLSLRSGPYLGASFIGVLRPDNAYVVHARNNDEGGGFTWYNVTAGERTGWASGRYLTIDGNRGRYPRARQRLPGTGRLARSWSDRRDPRRDELPAAAQRSLGSDRADSLGRGGANPEPDGARRPELLVPRALRWAGRLDFRAIYHRARQHRRRAHPLTSPRITPPGRSRDDEVWRPGGISLRIDNLRSHAGELPAFFHFCCVPLLVT